MHSLKKVIMKKYISRYLFLLIIVALSACKVTQDIAKPVAALPDTFRNSIVADTSSIGDIPWKNYFTDATLQSLIDSAISKNYDMQIAVKNIESAQLILKQTKYSYLPDAQLNIGANYSRYSDNSLNGLSAKQFLGASHIEDYTANVSLSWEADIWGKIKNQNAIALAAYLQTNEAKKLVQTNLVASISQAYYDLLLFDAQLKIAQQNVALNDSVITILKLQYNAGQVTVLAVQQAEAQRLAAAELIPQFEQNAIIQENAISVLSGALPNKIERKTILNQLPIAESLSGGVPADLVNRRPDVKSQEFALNIANSRVGIAKANMYPALRITAGGGLNSFKASNWFNIPASLFGVVGGSITQPIFMRKQLQTQFEVEKINREKTVLQFRQSVLNAVGEVSDALVQVDKLKARETITANRVQTLQQAINNANMLFKNGLANYLEVITAQSNVLQSELELASVKRSQLGASVELYRSLGGGWK
jgi:multidrug efflux system outer membrane protein